jgi:hypothetical protein
VSNNIEKKDMIHLDPNHCHEYPTFPMARLNLPVFDGHFQDEVPGLQMFQCHSDQSNAAFAFD